MTSPQVCIVLVRITHPGNIGFCARLLHNFGVADLRLVNCANHLSPTAKKQSANSEHILNKATVYKDLPSALSDIDFVIGTSSRQRRNLNNLLVLSQAIAGNKQSVNGKIAYIFGNEASGLSNDELSLCNLTAYIPISGAKISLNISHALAIVLYEHFNSYQKQHFISPKQLNTPSAKNIIDFKLLLFNYLQQIDFVKKDQADKLNEIISAIIYRAKPSATELEVIKSLVGKSIAKLSSNE